MADPKERLLPPRPLSSTNLRDTITTTRPFPTARPLFQGTDFLGLKKRGQGLRSWIRVDTSGNSQIMEVDKFTMMRRCDLPARDLRLLDPLFVYPSTILGREKAIVVNLEQIRCIITADEVLLLNSLDSYVLQYVVELQKRLTSAGAAETWDGNSGDLLRWRGGKGFDHHNNVFGNSMNSNSSTSPDYLPFEFRALEVALEAACTFLDAQKEEALRMYKNEEGPFKFEACWKIMKNNPKWCSQQLTKQGASKKQKTLEDDCVVVSHGDEAIDLKDPETAPIDYDGVPRTEGRKATKEKKKKKIIAEKGVMDVLTHLQCTLEKQYEFNKEELELKKEREKKEYELREQALKTELEIKKKAQKLKEEAQKLKEKAQKRKEQKRILCKDLTNLEPALRKTFEAMQSKILKEWENDGICGDVSSCNDVDV